MSNDEVEVRLKDLLNAINWNDKNSVVNLFTALKENEFSIDYFQRLLILKFKIKDYIGTGILSVISDELKNDKEVALLIAQLTENPFNHINERFKSDRDVALVFVGVDGYNLQYLSDELKADKDIVYKAVMGKGNAIKFADEKFFDDEQLIMLAIKTNFRAYTFATSRVQNIKEVKDYYEKQKLFNS